MKTRALVTAVSAVLASTAFVSADAFAAKGTPGKPPGGEASQSLSVPTIMVGTPPGGLNCGTTTESPTALVPPTGTPLAGYELDPTAHYWVQKVHAWQAQCFQAGTAKALGAWGDNLEGDAKLKAGSPIRVEIVLNNTTDFAAQGSALPTTLQGYKVAKLEPSKLDRESAYGHKAVDLGGGVFDDAPLDFPQLTTGTGETAVQGWLVHDSQITFSVQNLNTLAYAVPPGTNPTAEINATGKVVYGYNLRVGEPGPYRIQFTSSPSVEFTGVDAGTWVDAHNVYIDVTVVGGGGKGKGKP